MFLHPTSCTRIYTLSLHDALPISRLIDLGWEAEDVTAYRTVRAAPPPAPIDRKSTRLNSSHITISYAVFCLKKKKKSAETQPEQQLTYEKTHYDKSVHTANKSTYS